MSKQISIFSWSMKIYIWKTIYIYIYQNFTNKYFNIQSNILFEEHHEDGTVMGDPFSVQDFYARIYIIPIQSVSIIKCLLMVALNWPNYIGNWACGHFFKTVKIASRWFKITDKRARKWRIINFNLTLFK